MRFTRYNMAVRHGVDTCNWPALAVRLGARRSDRCFRWIFLRALGLIYYSAFFSLVFQIRGLIGPHGILPAGEYLQAVAERFGHAAYWYAPTLLWFSSSARMLAGICWVGMIASLLLV